MPLKGSNFNCRLLAFDWFPLMLHNISLTAISLNFIKKYSPGTGDPLPPQPTCQLSKENERGRNCVTGCAYFFVNNFHPLYRCAVGKLILSSFIKKLPSCHSQINKEGEIALPGAHTFCKQFQPSSSSVFQEVG